MIIRSCELHLSLEVRVNKFDLLLFKISYLFKQKSTNWAISHFYSFYVNLIYLHLCQEVQELQTKKGVPVKIFSTLIFVTDYADNNRQRKMRSLTYFQKCKLLYNSSRKKKKNNRKVSQCNNLLSPGSTCTLIFDTCQRQPEIS